MTVNNSTDSMKQFFKKYKFFTPIPEDVQKKIIYSRNKTLKYILKEAGSYTAYRFFLLSIYLKFRGIGIPVSINKINLLVPVLTFTAAGILFFLTVNILIPNFIQDDYYVNKGIVIFISGDVKLKRSGSDIKQFSLKDEIIENDLIVTGKDSSVALQMGKANLIFLKSESEIEFLSINSTKITDAQLNFGKALFKIVKTKNNSFFVRTPTCVASVRGTEFSISANEKESVAALDRGALEITHINYDKHILNESYSAVIADKYTSRPISIEEKIDLKRINLLSHYEKINRLNLEDLNKRNSILKEENIKIDIEIKKINEKEEIPSSLDEIKTKYGFLHEVHLFNGKIIKGFVLERKVQYKIVVPGRIIYIKAEEIENTIRI